MTCWFVSRHSGAIEWARQQRLPVDRFIPHLNVEEIQRGDKVIGTLPVELAAEVCRRGARFYALCVTLAEDQRGIALTAETLRACNARLREYHVTAGEETHEL